MEEGLAGIESELLDLSTVDIATLRSVDRTGMTAAISRVRESCRFGGQHQRLQRLLPESDTARRAGFGGTCRLIPCR
ncbi:hypothetical protein GCM10027614_01100 [Micromonospora vulcania]